MNQGMAGNGFISVVPTVEEPGKRRRGAPRKKQWWEDGWVLPPRRKKQDPLPHEPAIEAAREELTKVKRIKAAPPSELKRLSAQLGGLVRSANALERKIDSAKRVAEVEEQYRALQVRVADYTEKLEEKREKRLISLRADDDRLLTAIMEMD